jgi:seryl-tRNA synthetase
MLDIKYIRENLEKVKKGCEMKGVEIDFEKLLELDNERRKFLKELQEVRREKNRLSKEIGKKVGEEREGLILEMKKYSEREEKLEEKYKEIEKKFFEILSQIPNLPLEGVPEGKDESQNVVLKVWGKPKKFDFPVKDHLEIGENLDIIDTKRAAKTSGSRFGFLKKEGALLEIALINFALDLLLKEGFEFVIPPVLIRPELFWGMGYLEKGREDFYFIEKDNLILVGTAEQILGPMHANEIFEEKDLPKRYLGFSSCFRREAGSWGKDVRGILRVHQFDKLEMFSFCLPEQSQKEHEFFLEIEEKIMQALKIPYRVIKVCAGDMAFPTAAQYDIEAWIPSQNRYRETHSTSNCTDFQARRLNIRYRDQKTKKLHFVHTVNGTAIAIQRTIVAILENYQRKDGSVEIPKVLQKYLPFKEIKRVKK